MKISRVGLAVIGDEVLLGEVTDENIALISRAIFRIGAELAYASVLPDDMSAIIRHLDWMRREFDWVITTGGIGATHDDLTRTAISRLLEKPLVEDTQALETLRNRVGEPVPEGVRRLALFPEGSELIPNDLTAAPGFSIANLIVLPGIPRLVESMLEVLERKLNGAAVHTQMVKTMLYESQIARHLEEVQKHHPAVKIGSYPEMNAEGHRVRLVLRSRDRTALEAAKKELLERVVH